MKKIKLLVGITKAHDIPKAQNARDIALYDIDRYYVCNYPQVVALGIMRNYFLAHKKYTHLAILPDDLLITRPVLHLLLAQVQKHDFRYLAGCCNVDTTDLKDAISVSTRPVTAAGHYGRYRFLYKDTEEYRNLLQKCIDYDYPVKFYFEGFQFPIIRRDVIEQIPFHNDVTGGAQDVAFSIDVQQHGIPILVDLRAEMFHTKVNDSWSLVTLRVGHDKCDNYLVNSKGKEKHYDAPSVPVL